MKNLKRSAIIFFCFTVLGVAQKLSTDERTILYLCDQRIGSDGRLAAYLMNADANLRAKAAMAYANIQDTSALQSLVELLSDNSSAVRGAAAFALGQIGSPSSEFGILNRLQTERNHSVLAEELEAMGKLGSKAALDSLIEVVGSDKKFSGPAVAISLARFAIRGIKSERSIWKLFALLSSNDPGTQWKALFGLWRSSPNGQVDVEIARQEKQLSKLSRSANADVRINLATLLGRSKTEVAGTLLRAMFAAERRRDWRVEGQLVRAVALRLDFDADAVATIAGSLSHRNDHVLIAALQAAQNIPAEKLIVAQGRDELFRAAARLLNSAPSENVRGEAIVLVGKHFSDSLAAVVDAGAIYKSDRLYGKYVEAMSFHPTRERMVAFLETMGGTNVRASMGAWDFGKRMFSSSALRTLKIDSSGQAAIAGTVFEKMKAGIGLHDMAVTTLIANAVADSGFYASLRTGAVDVGAVDALTAEFQHLKIPDDVEAMQAILQMLGRWKVIRALTLIDSAAVASDRSVAEEAEKARTRIMGESRSKPAVTAMPKSFESYDWKGLEQSLRLRTATIRTSKGNVVLQLLPGSAPFTVASFAGLAKKEFYNGIKFHRVVPNFVVQGGDPRGDGWGGPGFSIRSEFSLSRYIRGAVGMASSGKDTEGCQFFITHQPTPHLDGRYTVFAGVFSGMDVVDRLQIGDTIQSVTVR